MKFSSIVDFRFVKKNHVFTSNWSKTRYARSTWQTKPQKLYNLNFFNLVWHNKKASEKFSHIITVNVGYTLNNDESVVVSKSKLLYSIKKWMKVIKYILFWDSRENVFSYLYLFSHSVAHLIFHWIYDFHVLPINKVEIKWPQIQCGNTITKLGKLQKALLAFQFQVPRESRT